jgi:hypothetical protein
MPASVRSIGLASLTAATALVCVATPARAAGNDAEIDFAAPPGYAVRHEAGMVVFAPAAPDRTPCVYGISPPRPSKGALDADAQAALAELVVPGWQRTSDWSHAAKGTAPAGWPYFRVQADFRRQPDVVSAMALALPAGPGRVHLLWGLGSPARCTFDDTAFARLFHSLRPRGWASDGGAGLLGQLHGTWRNTERTGLGQFIFHVDGRYERALSTATRLGLSERTSSGVEAGRYAGRSGALVLAPERGGRETTYRARVFDELSHVRGRWTRMLALLADDPGADEVRYDRID